MATTEREVSPANMAADTELTPPLIVTEASLESPSWLLMCINLASSPEAVSKVVSEFESSRVEARPTILYFKERNFCS